MVSRRHRPEVSGTPSAQMLARPLTVDIGKPGIGEATQLLLAGSRPVGETPLLAGQAAPELDHSFPRAAMARESHAQPAPDPLTTGEAAIQGGEPPPGRQGLVQVPSLGGALHNQRQGAPEVVMTRALRRPPGSGEAVTESSSRR